MTYIASRSINGQATVCGTRGWCPTLLPYMHGRGVGREHERCERRKNPTARGSSLQLDRSDQFNLGRHRAFGPTPEKKPIFCSSWSDLNPLLRTSEKCANRSLLPASGAMEPKPLESLKRHVAQGLQETVTMRHLCPSFEPIGLGAWQEDIQSAGHPSGVHPNHLGPHGPSPT